MTFAVHVFPVDPPTLGRRRFARARLGVPARLVTPAGTSDCTLMDLSRGGAQLRVGKAPSVGAMVVVEGLPIELFGAVRWKRPGRLGLEFQVPLLHDQVIALRRYGDDEAKRRRHAQSVFARRWLSGVF